MAKKKMNSTRKKISLAEGFLDGEDDVVNTPENAPVEETPKDEPVESDDENDLSDEPDTSDLDDDDDTPEKSDDEEAGVAEEKPEETENLQDTLQTLITAVQGLTDQIAKQNNGEGGAEDTVPADDATGETAPANNDDETAETAEPPESDESEESDAPEEDDSDYEGDDSSDDSEEDDSSDGDEVKNETIRQFFKPGKILNEKSDSLIGKLAHYRYDKIEPLIMAVVKSKIENRIAGAKSELRQNELARRLSRYESTEK